MRFVIDSCKIKSLSKYFRRKDIAFENCFEIDVALITMANAVGSKFRKTLKNQVIGIE